MIKRLRRKMVCIVVAVVALILLAIFFTMLFTTQKNNERMSIGVLRQALAMRSLSNAQRSPFGEGRPGPASQMRMPVLVVEIDEKGVVSTVSNQLHFIEAEDIAPIAALAASNAQPVGVLPNYALRYLREDARSGTRIAFIDISAEQELLKALILNALSIGGLAMLAFFILSLLLARWAVRPVEIAWEQQKQFIANASHELKTPLTVILSNADMLKTQSALQNDQNVRRMAHIHAEAVHMKQLVEDMLTLAQSDSHEQTQVHSTIDFSYIVKSAVLVYEPIFYDDGKKLFYQIEDGLCVKGDVARLQQVVHILLDNARKYAFADAAIHITLSKAEHKSALLQVSNQGTPIPKEDLEKIFLRFYRRDEARSEHGSFGLGLSIAQSIVKGHKGSIWAKGAETGNSMYCCRSHSIKNGLSIMHGQPISYALHT